MSLLFNRSPGLHFKQEGIVDNSSFGSLGFIAWLEIETISQIEFKGLRMIGIALKDLEKKLRGSSAIQQLTVKANQHYYKMPIVMSSNGLKISHDELLETFNSFHKRYLNNQ